MQGKPKRRHQIWASLCSEQSQQSTSHFKDDLLLLDDRGLTSIIGPVARGMAKHVSDPAQKFLSDGNLRIFQQLDERRNAGSTGSGYRQQPTQGCDACRNVAALRLRCEHLDQLWYPHGNPKAAHSVIEAEALLLSEETINQVLESIAAHAEPSF